MKASINGQQCQFDDGISVLDACRSRGIAIPTLCHDERLKPIGNCRMCLVEIEGKSHPVAACNTPLTDGMSISTHTLALENERRMVLRMLAQDHPGEAREESPQKPFYRQALRYGLSESDFNGSSEPHLVDDSQRNTRKELKALCASSTLHCSPATSASQEPASIRCAVRTTCRAQRTWAAIREFSQAAFP
jgi:predicted molibdopterin-dependent oxidoreductase YjgC